MIPLSVPHINGNEWQYIKECLDTGWVSSSGSFVNQFETMVAEYVGAKFGVAISNGTSGLHIALHLLNINRDHHVIVPNITFIASANSVCYTGAEPIFIDIDWATWQMDLDLLEKFIQDDCYLNDNGYCENRSTGKEIRAIMPVHVLGNLCDMDRLVSIANKSNIKIVEDASESLGSKYRNTHSGILGDIGVFSFNGNKIITTGGGGILVTNNKSIATKAKHLSTQAKVDPETYWHDEIGYNYRLVNILAAMGVAQMEQLPMFIEKKKYIDQYYRNRLGGIGDIQFQVVENYVDANCWLVTIRSSKQKKMLECLKGNKIMARPFWVPMNQLPMFENSIYVTEDNVSKVIHQECLSIPCSTNLTESDLAKVCSTLLSVFKENV